MFVIIQLRVQSLTKASVGQNRRQLRMQDPDAATLAGELSHPTYRTRDERIHAVKHRLCDKPSDAHHVSLQYPGLLDLGGTTYTHRYVGSDIIGCDILTQRAFPRRAGLQYSVRRSIFVP